MTQMVINALNSGVEGDAITLAVDICEGVQVEREPEGGQVQVHAPPELTAEMALTSEEDDIADDEGPQDIGDDNPPDLGHYDEDSDSESGESVHMEKELQELDNMLQEDSSSSQEAKEEHQAPLRRSARSTAGARHYDDAYEWNLMNLSVGAAVRNFGAVAMDTCKAELLQLFQEKKALIPV